MSSPPNATSPAPPAPYEVEECRGVLHVYSDGSIVRSPNPSFTTAIHDDGSVEWKDVLFDPSKALSLRLYRPVRLPLPEQPAGTAGSYPALKLPVFYYIHGGGFCIGSRTWPNFHNYCLRLASTLRAVVVAPDYRLAPEHRLPAALEDGAAAVEWLRAQACSDDTDPWLAEAADFTRVFISGDSAGGNIAHRLAVRYGGADSAPPLVIRGFVLLMPFFGGAEHTRSEAECPKDAFLNLELNDRYWRLALPHGASRDHPFANPFGAAAPALDPVEFKPMLVVVGGKDLLTERTLDYASRLREMGKPLEVVEFENEQHGFLTLNPSSAAADELMEIVKRFITDHAGST